MVEANGLAPWKNAGPMRLYCEKLGIVSSDDQDEDERAEREQWLEWGHVQEPVIADWYERTAGVRLQLGGHVTSVLHPWLWATLDRTIIGANKLVEIKNVGAPQLFSHWDVSSPDGVPRYVRAQVTVAMYVHGARETDVVASIGGRPPHVWTVFYDEELAEMLIAGAVRCWAMVTAMHPPPLDHTEASRAYLLAKYPCNADRVMLDATPEADAIAEEMIAVARQVSDGEKARKLGYARLLNLVGDADGIAGNGWKITWKTDKNGVRRPRFSGNGAEE